MPNAREFFAAFHVEIERLGLSLDSMPGGGLAADADALGDLLQRARALTPPVTWRDLIPDIPAHWVEGRPETWTRRYHPLGAYDHQSLPTGPAIHIDWPRTTDPGCLRRFIDEARAAGWPIYGGGFVEVSNPNWPTLDAMIVLYAGTDDARLNEFVEWIDLHSDATLAAIPRLGNERYVQDS
ncbi:MAG: hypothetical protein ACREND_11670 [Gemmatimonadaceae bacterium]